MSVGWLGRRRGADRPGDPRAGLSADQVLRERLLSRYGLVWADGDLVDLVSSTSTKFSRHLIVPLPNAVFRDNIQAGME